MFVYYKNTSEAGCYPEFSVGVLKQVISPVGVVCSCAVYDVVVYKLVSLVVVTVNTAVRGYPELLFSVFVDVSDTVVGQRMVLISHSVPDSVVLVTGGVGKTDDSVSSSEPVEPFGIPEQGIKLVSVSCTRDLRDRNELQCTVVA